MTPSEEAGLFRRIDTSLLYLPFHTALTALLDEALVLRSAFFVTDGYRSWDKQQALYEQGRHTPGPVVTNARAGESAHNYGLAADVVHDSDSHPGIQPDWEPSAYALLGELAPKHGLLWGGSWRVPDRPHLQWPGYVTLAELKPLREAYEHGGLLACWEVLDKQGATT